MSVLPLIWAGHGSRLSPGRLFPSFPRHCSPGPTEVTGQEGTGPARLSLRVTLAWRPPSGGFSFAFLPDSELQRNPNRLQSLSANHTKPHFIVEKTEAQRGKVTFLRSPNWEVGSRGRIHAWACLTWEPVLRTTKDELRS